LLREDHQKVKQLFKEFEQQPEDGRKRRIVETALRELEVHATIEEEIFYPALREQVSDNAEADELMDEADEEHAVAKHLIEQLKGMQPGDEHYDAKFIVLAENVRHHIQEEETEMLPKASTSGLDMAALGQRMMQRKQELLGRAGASGHEQAGEPEERETNGHGMQSRSRGRRQMATAAAPASGRSGPATRPRRSSRHRSRRK
jgi:hypothetical protein